MDFQISNWIFVYTIMFSSCAFIGGRRHVRRQGTGTLHEMTFIQIYSHLSGFVNQYMQYFWLQKPLCIKVTTVVSNIVVVVPVSCISETGVIFFARHKVKSLVVCYCSWCVDAPMTTKRFVPLRVFYPVSNGARWAVYSNERCSLCKDTLAILPSLHSIPRIKDTLTTILA